MTHIKKILKKHPDAASWHQQYPWFATGQIIAAADSKGKPEFEANAQKAAVFINNIPRLHWLLHQPDWEGDKSLSSLQNEEISVIPISSAPVPEENPSAVNDPPPQTFNDHPQFAIDLSGQPDDEDTIVEEEMPEENGASSHLSGSLTEAASRFKNEAPAEDSLLFETAYQHTIDYFASQGIKLEGEPAHDDRFGQQLKTFTSWLRQMKRLPNAPDPDTDLLVESHAAHSLQKGEVVTEPMVDVLLKQGKKQQAVQVLEKLRLLHPEKSLYFAARSEQIKHSK